jgi:deoxyribose-phosphate aldolase
VSLRYVQGMSADELAARIEHTCLRPDATSVHINQLCREALAHHFYGVCVNARWLRTARHALGHAGPHLVGVIGFPLGACGTAVKAYAAADAVAQGADEIDMVLDLGALKEGDYAGAVADVAAVVTAAAGAPVKVILEVHCLDEAQKMTACRIAQDGGAHFVKTCTGFGGGSATIADIQLMRSAVGAHLQIKASGGIRTAAGAQALVAAGADRLGTSTSVALVADAASPSAAEQPLC